MGSRVVAALAVLSVLTSPSPAAEGPAAPARKPLDLRAAPLKDALAALEAAYGVRYIARDEVLAAAKPVTLAGELTLEEALAEISKQAGVSAKVGKDGVVTISPAGAPEAGAAGAQGDALGGALDAVLAGNVPIESVRIRAWWDQEAAGTWRVRRRFERQEIDVHGRGVGFWREGRGSRPAEADVRQFALPREEVRRLLDRLRDARFPELKSPPVPAGPPGKHPGNPFAGIQVGELTLSIGDASKRVTQMRAAGISGELETLANDLLVACEAAGRKGVAAADLADGLGKIATGNLAPEALQIEFRRMGEGVGEAAQNGAWRLILDSGGAELARFDGSEYRPARRLALSPERVAALARALADEDVASLQGRDYPTKAHTYGTFRVFQHERAVQALVPGAPGVRLLPVEPARQARFERVVAAMEALRDELDTPAGPPKAGEPEARDGYITKAWPKRTRNLVGTADGGFLVGWAGFQGSLEEKGFSTCEVSNRTVITRGGAEKALPADVLWTAALPLRVRIVRPRGSGVLSQVDLRE